MCRVVGVSPVVHEYEEINDDHCGPPDVETELLAVLAWRKLACGSIKSSFGVVGRCGPFEGDPHGPRYVFSSVGDQGDPRTRQHASIDLWNGRADRMAGGEHFIDPRSSLRQAITSNSTVK
jgi:hypothetical protein